MTAQTNNWRIIDLINWGDKRFSQIGIENSRGEMEWFLCHVLKCQRIDLYIQFENILLKQDLIKLRKMVQRRLIGEPFQHIVGKGSFYGRDFNVDNNVLIPRPETEVIIECLKSNGKINTLLDIGTGSGCIAITCALEKLSEKIYATDISLDALKVARENMQLHNTESIQAACHDFLNKGFKTRFDVVISNPPYIAADEMDSLQTEVRDYDPEISLTDGADGYVFYRSFSKRFNDLISPGGYMLLEIGVNSHKEGVEKIFSIAGLKTTFVKDLQGDFRAVEVRK